MQRLKAIFTQLSVMVLICVKISTFAQSPIVINNESEINSAFQEYSPTFYANGLVFIGSNPAVNTEKKEDNQTGKSTTSIFFSQKGDNGLLQKPLTFAEELTTRFYDGPLSFSANGNTVYFTRSNLKKGKPVKSKDGAVKLKIYSAQKVNDKWVNISELPFNSSEFDCAHPSVSQDGRRLYFASNRKEGFGGMDLYVSTLINGAWSDPVNMGPKVNSAKDEVFPSVHADGKVYYSSNGRQGIGNLDIFYTFKTDTGWLLPRLLPEPINSRSDDFGFALAADKKTGYFASNRASGKGDDDIFSFTALEAIELMIEVDTPVSDNVVNNEDSPIDQTKTESIANAEPQKQLASEPDKENTSIYTATLDQPITKIETVVELKKEDSAILKPAATPQTEIKIETVAEVKKDDKETKATAQVATTELKTEVNAPETAQSNAPTLSREPAFDETATPKIETSVAIELPSEEPLKKLSEPEMPLSKTDISETAIVASQEFNTEGGNDKTAKLIDSSLKPIKESIHHSIAKRKTKPEQNDKPIDKQLTANVKDETSVSLTTSSQIKDKYLVVVGTYSIKQNAIDQKKIAVEKGFTETEIVQYEDNNLFGVCVRHFDDQNAAQALARSILQQKKMDAFVKVLK